MTDYNIGKGVYIWQPESIAGGNPQATADRLNLAGVQSAVLKITDGVQIYNNLGPLIQALKAGNIRVAGWGYSYLNKSPVQEAQTIIRACNLFQLDMYLIDVEKEVEGNDRGAGQFMSVLRPGLPKVALGLNTFWSVLLHPTFPWSTFFKSVDFVCPQVYWRGDQPVEKLKTSQQEYAARISSVGVNVPMPIVAGDMFNEANIKPTPDQVLQFLGAVEADPSLHGVFMWAADERETTPALWKAFSAYQWHSGPNPKPIPQQPLGWAKIIPGGGMWIRSTPLGSKVGALGKGRMVPIWDVTDSKWGAITTAKNQWIYIGDPTVVELAIDPDAIPIPAPGLFTAVVIPAQGVNVRESIGGRILRALPVGTVVTIYAEQSGWARINADASEWVNETYLKKTS